MEANRFQVLEIAQLESFEDDTFTPFALNSTQRSYKPFHKCKRGQKMRTTQHSLALNHTQKIRHPSVILKSTSPTRAQFLMNFSDPVSTTGRAKLRDQIAVLRAIRGSSNPKESKKLLPADDTRYLADFQEMLHAQEHPPTVAHGSRYWLFSYGHDGLQ